MDVEPGISQINWESTVRRVDDSLHAIFAAQTREIPKNPHFWSRGVGMLKARPDGGEPKQALQGSHG